MLENVSKIINDRILQEESSEEFRELISESFADENIEFIDRSKSNMLDLFSEDTMVDLDKINSGFTSEEPFDDNYKVELNSDLTDDDLTDLQSEKAFDDNYSSAYDHDLETNNLLDKEVAYSDNQRTPVDISGYSAESSGLFNENYYAEEGGKWGNETGLKITKTAGGFEDNGGTYPTSMFFEDGEEISENDLKEKDMFFEDEIPDGEQIETKSDQDGGPTIDQYDLAADDGKETIEQPDNITEMMFECGGYDDTNETSSMFFESKDEDDDDDDKDDKKKKDDDVEDAEDDEPKEDLDDDDDDEDDDDDKEDKKKKDDDKEECDCGECEECKKKAAKEFFFD